jgi:hypothetical protein
VYVSPKYRSRGASSPLQEFGACGLSLLADQIGAVQSALLSAWPWTVASVVVAVAGEAGEERVSLQQSSVVWLFSLSAPRGLV